VLTAPEQGTPFTFGHSPPDTELDAVVERLRQAQCPDRTASADQFGSVLCRTLHEQGIRIDFSAFGAYRHLFIPHVAPLPRSACVVFVTPPPGMSGDGRGTVAAPRTLVTGPDGGPHGTSSGFFGSLRSSLSLVSKLRFVPVRQQSPRGLFLAWPSRAIATQESVTIHAQRVTEHGMKSLIETKGRVPLTGPRNTQDDLQIHQG